MHRDLGDRLPRRPAPDRRAGAVIDGDADWILPYPDTGKRLPGLVKDMQLMVIEGGPHAIAWTHTDQVNRALLGFLAG